MFIASTSDQKNSVRVSKVAQVATADFRPSNWPRPSVVVLAAFAAGLIWALGFHALLWLINFARTFRGARAAWRSSTFDAVFPDASRPVAMPQSLGKTVGWVSAAHGALLLFWVFVENFSSALMISLLAVLGTILAGSVWASVRALSTRAVPLVSRSYQVLEADLPATQRAPIAPRAPVSKMPFGVVLRRSLWSLNFSSACAGGLAYFLSQFALALQFQTDAQVEVIGAAAVDSQVVNAWSRALMKDDVLANVAEKLQLAKYREFNAAIQPDDNAGRFLEWLGFGGPQAGENERDRVLKALRARVNAAPGAKSSAIRLRVTAGNPDLPRSIASTLVSAANEVADMRVTSETSQLNPRPRLVLLEPTSISNAVDRGLGPLVAFAMAGTFLVGVIWTFAASHWFPSVKAVKKSPLGLRVLQASAIAVLLGTVGFYVASTKVAPPPQAIEPVQQLADQATVGKAPAISPGPSHTVNQAAGQDAATEQTAPKFTLLWPVKGRLIAGYGVRADGTHNSGLDIAVPPGTDVHAAQSGVVAYSGSDLRGFGNLVLLRHDNGWITAYAHNDVLLVKRGDKVTRGQVIGKSGKSGDQPQVHFELRQNSKTVDPSPYFEKS